MKPYEDRLLPSLNIELGTTKNRKKGLSVSSLVPDSIGTFMRAQFLIAIYFYQPLSRVQLEKMGFRKTTISKFIRDFRKDRLATNSGILCRLTEEGEEYINVLLKDTRVRSWFNHVANFFPKAEIPRIRELYHAK